MLLLTVALLPALIDPALCRQQSSGQARWATDGKGILTVSTEARFVGEVVLRCRIRVPAATEQISVELDSSEISFQPAGARESGSGVVVEANGARMAITRVAGEDWIQTPRRSITVAVKGEVLLLVRLIDNSAVDPVRVDLRRLRITSAAAPEREGRPAR